MGMVFSHMTMSLDGFIADPRDRVEDLFEWYETGEVPLPTASRDVTLRVDGDSAGVMRELTESCGALVAGRRLFDITDGWGDTHPVGAPVVVVTHRPPEDAATRWPRTSFVTDIGAAVTRAREIAGDKDVILASASVTQQALDLGLVDEVWVSLVPVLLGEGIPYFAKLHRGHVFLKDPAVVQGHRALHLRYRVQR
ncbi:dihydrofolate reductase family protein [Streptomyces sp. 7-21]|nr:dihydrofolate reductase family protein [Streptomyces sp. 7-21]